MGSVNPFGSTLVLVNQKEKEITSKPKKCVFLRAPRVCEFFQEHKRSTTILEASNPKNTSTHRFSTAASVASEGETELLSRVGWEAGFLNRFSGGQVWWTYCL